jgi:tetratricopeptide (TPR) repeat protein
METISGGRRIPASVVDALSPAARIRVLAGAAAVAAGGAVVWVVLAAGTTPPQPKTQCKTAPQPLIVPGVATTEVVASVRASFAAWPNGTLGPLELLARDHPEDAVVRFNYGVALLCRGYLTDATQAFEAAKSSGRDTFYEMRADEILHPQFFQPTDGLYPLFQPVGSDPLLDRGAVEQREGHQHSAETLFARAARLHPDEAEAQVAAAVGLFDEDHLTKSFSRLGQLSQRFPASQSVHFHLALLSAWVGLRTDAQKQFRLALGLGPTTTLGKQAAAFVQQLAASGTTGAKR